MAAGIANTAWGFVLAGIGAGGAIGTVALAQPMSPSLFQRVDAGRADTGPLATSIIQFPEDLRVPTGFEYVYRDPRDEGSLIRVSGGLIAEFPRSQYDTAQGGFVPVVPPGTVFRIGMPGAWSWDGGERGLPVQRSFNAIDRRVPVTGAPTRPSPDDSIDRSMWQSDVYRAIRVRELLRSIGPEGSDVGPHAGSER